MHQIKLSRPSLIFRQSMVLCYRQKVRENYSKRSSRIVLDLAWFSDCSWSSSAIARKWEQRTTDCLKIRLSSTQISLSLCVSSDRAINQNGSSSGLPGPLPDLLNDQPWILSIPQEPKGIVQGVQLWDPLVWSCLVIPQQLLCPFWTYRNNGRVDPSHLQLCKNTV